jgi:hypothetical protein
VTQEEDEVCFFSTYLHNAHELTIYSLVNMNLLQRKKSNPKFYFVQSLFQSAYPAINIKLVRSSRGCRRGRVTIAEREALAQDTEEALKKKEQEAEERRKQSHDMVAESIKRELAESERQLFLCRDFPR